MLYQSLSQNNLHLCGDRDPRTKLPLQPAFLLSLSRFALVFYPLLVRLNEKMNCVSWIMVINQKLLKFRFVEVQFFFFFWGGGRSSVVALITYRLIYSYVNN